MVDSDDTRPAGRTTGGEAAPGASAWRPSMTDRRLFKMGSIAGIWGSIVAFPFVVTHPHLPPGSAVGVLETVRDFGPWLFLHMGLGFEVA